MSRHPRIHDPSSAPPPQRSGFGTVPFIAYGAEWDGPEGLERFTSGDFKAWPIWTGLKAIHGRFLPIAEQARTARMGINSFYQFFYRLDRSGLGKIVYDEQRRIIDVIPAYSTKYAEACLDEIEKERARRAPGATTRRAPKRVKSIPLPTPLLEPLPEEEGLDDSDQEADERAPDDKECAPPDETFIPMDKERAPGRALSYPPARAHPIRENSKEREEDVTSRDADSPSTGIPAIALAALAVTTISAAAEASESARGDRPPAEVLAEVLGSHLATLGDEKHLAFSFVQRLRNGRGIHLTLDPEGKIRPKAGSGVDPLNAAEIAVLLWLRPHVVAELRASAPGIPLTPTAPLAFTPQAYTPPADCRGMPSSKRQVIARQLEQVDPAQPAAVSAFAAALGQRYGDLTEFTQGVWVRQLGQLLGDAEARDQLARLIATTDGPKIREKKKFFSAGMANLVPARPS